MTTKRTPFLAGTALAILAATPALAAPGEILVETRLSDPDPGYVPPPVERKPATKHREAKEPSLDEAFENLGRVAGQAAQIMQQRAVDRLVQAQSAGSHPKD